MDNNQPSFNKIKRSIFAGVFFTTVRCSSLIIVQPSEVVKITEQSNLTNSTREVISRIYKNQALEGFIKVRGSRY